MSRALQDQGLAHHDCVEGRSSQSCNTLGTENSVSEPFKVGVSVSKACASMVVGLIATTNTTIVTGPSLESAEFFDLGQLVTLYY